MMRRQPTRDTGASVGSLMSPAGQWHADGMAPRPQRALGGTGWFLAGYGGVAGFFAVEAGARERGRPPASTPQTTIRAPRAASSPPASWRRAWLPCCGAFPFARCREQRHRWGWPCRQPGSDSASGPCGHSGRRIRGPCAPRVNRASSRRPLPADPPSRLRGFPADMDGVRPHLGQPAGGRDRQRPARSRLRAPHRG